MSGLEALGDSLVVTEAVTQVLSGRRDGESHHFVAVQRASPWPGAKLAMSPAGWARTCIPRQVAWPGAEGPGLQLSNAELRGRKECSPEVSAPGVGGARHPGARTGRVEVCPSPPGGCQATGETDT